MLLQKTLLNIEGLGRELDPDLDLWVTAKPFLERWMGKQVGLSGLIERLGSEATQWSQLLPQMPRMLHGALTQLAHPPTTDRTAMLLEHLVQEQRKTQQWIRLFVLGLVILAGLHFYH